MAVTLYSPHSLVQPTSAACQIRHPAPPKALRMRNKARLYRLEEKITRFFSQVQLQSKSLCVTDTQQVDFRKLCQENHLDMPNFISNWTCVLRD